MEYFEGKQLFDMIAEQTSFGEQEVSKIIKTILEAIKYCHDHNVMHKDIKPKKILIDSEGNLKLVDFGLSKWDYMSKFQIIAGTPYYISPEILKSVKSSKSDIWSIGVIMFTLLSGRLPFVSDHNETVFHKAIKGDFDFSSTIWDTISEEAKDLIRRMICIDLSKRYTAEE